MTAWIAVSYGALDLRGTIAENTGAQLAVTPVHPGEPVLLSDDVAALWRSITEGPVADGTLTAESRKLLVEFETYGIASRDVNHPDRTTHLSTPWLSSPTHELLYALITKLASQSHVDMLFIKGPVLHAQGLREREHSGDIDAWVRPGQQGRLSASLRRWGWTEAPTLLSGTPLAHSITLRPGGWGCEIDLHFRFPGIALSDETAFERIMDTADKTSFAGVEANVPDRASHAVIQALHLVRPTPGRPPDERALTEASMALSRAGVHSGDAAERLAAQAVLSDALALAFGAQGRGAGLPLPSDWRWRSSATNVGAHLRIIQSLPRRARLGYLWKALRLDPEPSTERPGGVAGRLARWRRACRQLFTLRNVTTPGRGHSGMKDWYRSTKRARRGT